MNIWFTSDHHFGHKNILEYEKYTRPFVDLDEMEEALIDKWNCVVKSNDIVWHLGDFAFGAKNIAVADRLNGRKKLILGNHDIYPIAEYAKYFEKIYGAFVYKNCILSHIPVHSDILSDRWSLNIHGHLHSKSISLEDDIYNHWKDPQNAPTGLVEKKKDENYFNVSVEQNKLEPFNFDVIQDRINQLK